MKLPITRRACAKLYRYRRFNNRALTKLDMYLGGMICCSEEEFLYRKSDEEDDGVIGGIQPCLCKCEKICLYNDCIDETDKTLRMPWDAPLYGGNEK